ncbi:MAG TPA: COX15/CtaA family protein [Nitrososphaerales archaeon]|nr:COX15/CtaA family protein [Nitrososphaerales archaeon]
MKGRLVLLSITVISLFLLLVVGAYVTAAMDGEACGTQVPADWPLCLGNLLPPPVLAPVAEYSHRLLAALSSLLLFVSTFVFWRQKQKPVARALAAASLLVIAEVVLGGAVVAQDLYAELVALHQALGILIFGVALYALSMARRETASLIPP